MQFHSKRELSTQALAGLKRNPDTRAQAERHLPDEPAGAGLEEQPEVPEEKAASFPNEPLQEAKHVAENVEEKTRTTNSNSDFEEADARQLRILKDLVASTDREILPSSSSSGSVQEHQGKLKCNVYRNKQYVLPGSGGGASTTQVNYGEKDLEDAAVPATNQAETEANRDAEGAGLEQMLERIKSLERQVSSLSAPPAKDAKGSEAEILDKVSRLEKQMEDLANRLSVPLAEELRNLSQEVRKLSDAMRQDKFQWNAGAKEFVPGQTWEEVVRLASSGEGSYASESGDQSIECWDPWEQNQTNWNDGEGVSTPPGRGCALPPEAQEMMNEVHAIAQQLTSEIRSELETLKKSYISKHQQLQQNLVELQGVQENAQRKLNEVKLLAQRLQDQVESGGWEGNATAAVEADIAMLREALTGLSGNFSEQEQWRQQAQSKLSSQVAALGDAVTQ